MENKGSKSNLNESVLPLLEDEVHKEKIELKDHSTSKESSDTDNEKSNDPKQVDDAIAAAKKKKEEEKERKRKLKEEEEERKKQLKLEKQKKKEEEKEMKKQKKAEKKNALQASNGTNVNGFGSNINFDRLNQFTVGINLWDRDEKSINNHVNVSFEDVIGEPDSTQGFEAAYRLSFGLFQFVRFWFYRIVTSVLALPLALVWALVFGVLSLLSVWIITPGFRVLDILFYFIYRVWNGLVRTFLDPIFASIALVRQTDAKSFHLAPTSTSSGRSIVYKNGAKYLKVNSNETAETYKTNNDPDSSSQEQVTVTIDN
ncbi:hypothetical protein NH340_JMT05926 [Sarcoptes scabiei]|nr:hypothetical protein NH340_JMT05926 [Sarcoptes scabiei]